MTILDRYLEIADYSSNPFNVTIMIEWNFMNDDLPQTVLTKTLKFLYELNSDFAKYSKKSICKVICLMSDFQIMISSLCVKAIYERIFV